MSRQITNTVIENQVCWHNGENTWLSVPKNANMMMRRVLERNGYRKIPIANITIEKPFAIIRDPHTRLLSATGEYLKRRGRERSPKTMIHHLEKLLQDPDDFDEHLEPQSFWISPARTQCEFLRFEHLQDDLKAWLPKKVVNRTVKTDMLKHSRRVEADVIDQIWNKNPDLVREIVTTWYQEDLEIWLALQEDSSEQ